MYRIVALRENETVRWLQSSELIAIAKARVWASEGWQFEITEDDGSPLNFSDPGGSKGRDLAPR